MLNPLKPTIKGFYNSTIKSTIKSTNEKIKKHPMLFASGFACIKNIVADYTVQKTQNEGPLNIKRNIAFALFGFIHVGAGQYIILNKIIPRIIPTLNKIPTPSNAVLKGITLDQFVHVPLIYFPLFYTFKEFGESTISNPPEISNIIKNYKENFKNDMIISGSIFMPIQFLNYKFMPTHLRVPLLSSCGFLYVMLLSYLRL